MYHRYITHSQIVNKLFIVGYKNHENFATKSQNYNQNI